MTDVDLMVRAIEYDPDDLTAVCALTDALIEERDMTHAEAERHAEHVVRSARDARDLGAAADLLRAEKPWHHELSRDILEMCHLPAASNAQVIIAPGEAPPAATEHYRSNPGAWWYETTITVGALWVVRYWRSNPSLCLMPKPTRQGKTPTNRRGTR